MKAIFAVVLLAVVALASATSEVDEARFMFNSWMKTHNKQYTTTAELKHRFNVFQANMKIVFRHNEEAAAGKHTYTLGMNKFADLTNEEYRSMYLKYNRTTPRTGPVYHAPKNVRAPTSVDWRQQGAVTPVKDQGQCGSCWSFSATGAMEGALVAVGKQALVSLSEQNLVDCVKGGSYNCETGGVMQDGYAYVISSKGIESESEYPYCGIDCDGEACKFSSSKIAAKISSYKNVQSGSEADLLTATVGQPVSVAIDASSNAFQLYSGGVFNHPLCSSTQLDHGVLVVGYGVYNGVDYWLVKNSWGDSWGLQGYIMMSRNKNNQCGIATDASIALP